MADVAEVVEVDVTMTTNKMQRSAYAAVVFHNVAEMYPSDAHIQCSYTITSDITPSTRDWVGLYKVGWMNPRDYYYYEWAPFPKDYQPECEAQSEILFQCHTLPEDDGEFYQFCYVSNSGQIRGASTPFQFKRPSAGDFVEIEDTENDMLIVREKTLYLEDNLKEAKQQKTALIQQQEETEKEKKDLKSKLKELRKQLKVESRSAEKLQKDLHEKKQELDDNNKNTKDLIVVHDELILKLDELSMDKVVGDEKLKQLESVIDGLKEREKILQTDKDELNGQNKMLTDEMDMFKNHLAKSEGTVSNYAGEIKKMQKDVEEKESYIAACQMEIATLKSSLHQQATQNERQNHVMASNVDNVEKLQEKLRNTEDKLEAAVKIKELMSDELGRCTDTSDQQTQELQARRSENLELKKNVERMELEFSQESDILIRENDGVHRDLCNVVQEKEELQKKVTMLQEDLSKDSTTGPMYALTIANETLKQRHKIMKADVEKVQGEMKTIKNTATSLENDLRREIQDLKERIVMCSDAYRQLYKENVKIQKKCKHCRSKILSESTDVLVLKTDQLNRAVSTETETVSLVTSHSNTDYENMASKETQSDVSNNDFKTKLIKYKKLFMDEKDKCEALKQQFGDDMKKKDIELFTLKSTVTVRPTDLEHKLMSCTSFLAEKDKMIEDLNQKLREIKTEQEVVKSPRKAQQISPVESLNLIYGNPYLRQDDPDTEKMYPARTNPVNLPPLIYPHIPQNMPLHHMMASSSSQDHLSDSDNSDGLQQPISPTILPSAKVAAIRAHICPHTDDQAELNFVDAPSDFEKTTPTAPIDLEEDKFVDAKGDGMKTCPACEKCFSVDISDSEYEQHVLNHSGRICPICNQLADDNTSDTDFEYHVNCCIDTKNKND